MRHLRLLLLCGVLMFAAATTFSQRKKPNLSAITSLATTATATVDSTFGIHRVWLHGGIGGGTEGLAGTIGLTLAFGRKDNANQNIITLRAAGTGRIYLGSDGSGSHSDNPSDVGLLYGFTTLDGSSHFSVAAGLGYVSGTLYGRDNKPTVVETVGIPFEAQLFVNAYVIGLGFTVFGNLNFSQSFVGFAVCVAVGKLF